MTTGCLNHPEAGAHLGACRKCGVLLGYNNTPGGPERSAAFVGEAGGGVARWAGCGHGGLEEPDPPTPFLPWWALLLEYLP